MADTMVLLLLTGTNEHSDDRRSEYVVSLSLMLACIARSNYQTTTCRLDSEIIIKYETDHKIIICHALIFNTWALGSRSVLRHFRISWPWKHHEKSIQISTNMSRIGLVIPEITCEMLQFWENQHNFAQ